MEVSTTPAAKVVAVAEAKEIPKPKEEIKPLDTILKSGTERSPLLYKDGTFKMNVGPIEFK